MKRMLWSVFVAMASFGAVVRAHGATNNVVGFNFTVQHAAASPLTNEVVFSRDGKVVFGYDLDAKQTNWIYQPLGSPDLLAFSSDGAYLFIGLPGSNGVLQVEAPTRTPVRLIRTGRVFRIVPVPGEPESILTSTASDGTFGALAVWDAGVRRTFTNGASGGTIYGGKVYYRTAQNVVAAAFGPQGLTVERSAAAFSSFPGHLTVTEKYVIESPGYVRDRATLSVIGRLPIALESSELTIPYEESDCLLIAQATTNYVVQSYRLSNLQFTG